MSCPEAERGGIMRDVFLGLLEGIINTVIWIGIFSVLYDAFKELAG